jgi:hypothetical protein
MARGRHLRLIAEVKQFEIEIRALADEIVRDVLVDELARRAPRAVRVRRPTTRATRGAATRAARGATTRAARGATTRAARGATKPATWGATKPVEPRVAPPAAPTIDAAPAPPAEPPVEAASVVAETSIYANGKRRTWTRERVIDELARWLMAGGAVEASFVARHGQPGLVAGAKRLFGRFDAALNAANLHLARQHPDRLPSKEG